MTQVVGCIVKESYRKSLKYSPRYRTFPGNNAQGS